MSLSNFVKRVRNIMRNDAGINGDAQRIYCCGCHPSDRHCNPDYQEKARGT